MNQTLEGKGEIKKPAERSEIDEETEKQELIEQVIEAQNIYRSDFSIFLTEQGGDR